MRLRLVGAVVFSALLAGFGSPAKAGTYDVNFVGSFFDVFATINFDPSGDILSITGTDSSPGGTFGITGLITQPGTPPAQGTFFAPSGHGWNYNDVFNPAGNPYFDKHVRDTRARGRNQMVECQPPTGTL